MFEGQPKGLYALALANTGERFGYYTMLAIFTLFYKQSLVTLLLKLLLFSDVFWLLFILSPSLAVFLPISLVMVRW